MIRKISLTDLKKAVDGAYEEYKDIKKGEVDPRITNADVKKFGITVMLTDGTTVSRGDTEVKAPLGDIANVAVHAQLLQQYGVKVLIKKAGKTCGHKVRKLELPISAHGIRAVSAVEPQNDADGKYEIISSMLMAMLGSEPVLDDKLYETLAAQVDSEDVVNKLASVDYEVYDDTETSAKMYAKLEALTVDTEQAAAFGATMAADGVNPVTKEPAYDAKYAAALTTIAGINTRPDRLRRWFLKSGVPAVFSFGGMVVAVMPGLGAIAAYAPEVGKHGRSKKGARAVRYITEAIGYNIFGSTYVEYEK